MLGVGSGVDMLLEFRIYSVHDLELGGSCSEAVPKSRQKAS